MATMERRQGYGAVSGSISKGAHAVSGSASQGAQSLSRGQLIGLVVGVLLLAAVLVGTTWWCCVRSARRRDAQRRQEQDAVSDFGPGATDLRRGQSFAQRSNTKPTARANQRTRAAAMAAAGGEPGPGADKRRQERPLLPLSQQDAASAVPMVEIAGPRQPRRSGRQSHGRHSDARSDPFADGAHHAQGSPPGYSSYESSHPYRGSARDDYGSPFASRADVYTR